MVVEVRRPVAGWVPRQVGDGAGRPGGGARPQRAEQRGQVLDHERREAGLFEVGASGVVGNVDGPHVAAKRLGQLLGDLGRRR
jgi:hypothetical protein